MEVDSTFEEEHNQQIHKNTNTRQEMSSSYFINDNPQLSMQNDAKYHGKTYLLTLALLKAEINNIIDPSLASAEINGEVKAYLQTKKTELNKFHTNLMTMFSNGQLNPTKYMQVITKMKNINIELVQDLSNNATADTHRIKQRLRILEAEAEEYRQKANNESMSIETVGPESMGVSGYFSKIDKLPPQSLAKLIQKRATQYWNLANFITEQILPNQEPEEQAQTRERLQNFFYPLITKANQYVKELEEGIKPPEAARFFRKEMLDMNPAVLHGKSLEERKLDLEKLIEAIEDCIKQEEEYINVLKSSMEDPDQPAGANGKKIKESEKNIAKYNEYIETLSKLSAQKYAWMPTPKVSISKEQRLVSLSNGEIPANALQVEFKRLSNLNKGSYWIRWGIEAQDGYRSFETDYCDSKALTFNYKELVEMTSKLRMEQSLEHKEIRVEVLYKKFIYFTECKDSEGAIPLSDFRKTNLIQGKLKLNSGAELHYVLKIKHPLTKNTRMEISTVHAFQLFPVFTKDAPTPQAQQTNPRSSRVSNVTTASQAHRRPSNPTASQSSVPCESKSIIIEQENFPVPKPKEIRQPEKMEILAPTVSNEERKMPEKPANSTGGGLFQKKKYPPLVLLKADVDPLASLTENDVPEGLTLEEVVNPGNPEKMESVTVLKRLAEELEKARSELAGEGRKADNRLVSDNWAKALRKATVLEAQFGQGEVDPMDYVAKLKEVVAKDNMLAELYEKKGDNDRLVFVRETMKIMEGEIKEIEEALAGES